MTLNDTPPMEFDLSYPKELGGSGKGEEALASVFVDSETDVGGIGPNPEQFFACVLSLLLPSLSEQG